MKMLLFRMNSRSVDRFGLMERMILRSRSVSMLVYREDTSAVTNLVDEWRILGLRKWEESFWSCSTRLVELVIVAIREEVCFCKR